MAELNKKSFEKRMHKEDLKTRPAKFMAEHTVTNEDTLSHISLKYYGSAAKEKWMIIYEANKAVIGDNPNKIRPGLVLKIPELSK
jgi:nucleoid-associated protein YgaU